MAPQLFFVGTRLLGSREVPNFKHTDLGPQMLQGFCWYCRKCGEIWGRLVVPDAQDTMLWSRACARHGDGRLWAGGPDSPGYPELTFGPDWPTDALRYEFERSIEFALRSE